MAEPSIGSMRRRRAAAIVVAGLLGCSPVAAAAQCGICATSIVTNSSLAACFLERYEELSLRDSPAIVVNLGDCEIERGVVPELATPTGEALVPDVEFIVTRPQLDCLYAKLDQHEGDLDPHAVIDLSTCSG